MASLTIDAFRQAAGEHGFGARLITRRRDFRITVVAKHAVVSYRTPETGVIRTIVARIHRPIASVFGIPCKWKLDQRISPGAMQEGAHVAPGSHDEMYFLFHEVRLFSVEANLVTALVVFAVASQHFKITVGCFVIEGSPGCI